MFLERSLPGIVVIGSKGRPESFEVINMDSGKSYWSRLSGHGFLDGDQTALDSVIEAILRDKKSQGDYIEEPLKKKSFPTIPVHRQKSRGG